MSASQGEGRTFGYSSHSTREAANQPPPLVDYNPYTQDAILVETARRESLAWIEERAIALGAIIGSERMLELADQANRNTPELRSHDRYGERIDRVDYHPAYHELMALAFGHGLHSLAWTEKRAGAFSARAVLYYLWNQGENGVSCPVTMSFAAVQVLRQEPALAAQWEPKLLANAYDPRPLPLAEKRGVTIGMAMTEKQGGTDLRANLTQAARGADGAFELFGHKWFCSAPMSDGFFSLAQADEGITCFFVPRSLPDGTRNRFFIQRLKDKVGNRSNASAEVEYHGTWACQVGEAGRGISTLIEMAHLTRFDIVVASAGIMRAALTQALYHCSHRRVFGAPLIELPLMRNVLADLALESEAATLLAMRLARAFDMSAMSDHERRLCRIATPAAKYWLCKRNPQLTLEALECIGGNGYVEEGVLGRFFREAPVNGIWEGSANVICLDVLRAIARDPRSLAAVLDEIDDVAQQDPRLKRLATRIETAVRDQHALEELREEWMEVNDFVLHDHPRQSPDLNRIEKAWAYFKSQVFGRRPKAEKGFHRIMQTVWMGLDASTLSRFIDQLPSLMAVVHEAPQRQVQW